MNQGKSKERILRTGDSGKRNRGTLQAAPRGVAATALWKLPRDKRVDLTPSNQGWEEKRGPYVQGTTALNPCPAPYRGPRVEYHLQSAGPGCSTAQRGCDKPQNCSRGPFLPEASVRQNFQHLLCSSTLPEPFPCCVPGVLLGLHSCNTLPPRKPLTYPGRTAWFHLQNTVFHCYTTLQPGRKTSLGCIQFLPSQVHLPALLSLSLAEFCSGRCEGGTSAQCAMPRQRTDSGV